MDAGIADEEKLFRARFAIAKEHNKPVIVHTPTPLEPQAVDVCRQIIKVLESERFPMDKVVFDHTGRESLKDRLDTGAMVGLSLCYDKLRPEDAAEIVAEYPEYRSQLLVNSEFGYAGEGYFWCAWFCLSMRRLGLKRDVIEGVTWDNPKRFLILTSTQASGSSPRGKVAEDDPGSRQGTGGDLALRRTPPGMDRGRDLRGDWSSPDDRVSSGQDHGGPALSRLRCDQPVPLGPGPTGGGSAGRSATPIWQKSPARISRTLPR